MISYLSIAAEMLVYTIPTGYIFFVNFQAVGNYQGWENLPITQQVTPRAVKKSIVTVTCGFIPHLALKYVFTLRRKMFSVYVCLPSQFILKVETRFWLLYFTVIKIRNQVLATFL